jgi:hypothetical protein
VIRRESERNGDFAARLEILNHGCFYINSSTYFPVEKLTKAVEQQQ